MASFLPTIFRRSLLDLYPISSIKLALYNGTVPAVDTMDLYTTTGEVSGTGYTAGGNGASVTLATFGVVAVLDVANMSWVGTFTTTYGLLYATAAIATVTNRALALFDWGGSKSVSGGTFTVTFPASAAATSTIQIA